MTPLKLSDFEIEIKNLRKDAEHGQPWEVRVDRGTYLGNPFYMHDESERDLVCDKYAEYFKQQLLSPDTKFMQSLNYLWWLLCKYHKLTMYCWCAPKRCHAETIKEYLISRLKDIGAE